MKILIIAVLLLSLSNANEQNLNKMFGNVKTTIEPKEQEIKESFNTMYNEQNINENLYEVYKEVQKINLDEFKNYKYKFDVIFTIYKEGYLTYNIKKRTDIPELNKTIVSFLSNMTRMYLKEQARDEKNIKVSFTGEKK